jgi:pimeloyl-ACP methyl ester carboxylesterase
MKKRIKVIKLPMNFIPNSELDIEIDGSKLRFYFYDFNPENPPLLILHGLRADTNRVLPIINLIKHRYNVISFDLPGFGNSKNFEESKYQNKNYIEYNSSILQEIFTILGSDSKELAVLGISNGANILLDFKQKNQDSYFQKIVLFAPIFSYQYLSMKPSYKKFVDWITDQTMGEKWAGKLLQKIILNDTLCNIAFKVFDKKSRKDKAILDYERSQWRLMTMKHWGKTLHDFLRIDYSAIHSIFKDEVTFVYPQHDQYLDVEKTVEEFKKQFPNANFLYFDSDQHIPRGNYMENKTAGKSIEDLINKI